MYIEEQHARKVFGSDSTMGLFVALYLILLAFFIVLTSISQQSTARASAAMESVNAAFTDAGVADNGFSQTDLRSAASDPILIKIERAFSTAFDIKGQYAVSSGYIYQVQLPATYLFEAGSFRVRTSVHPVLNELLAVLKNAPNGRKQEMALLFGSGAGMVDRELTRSQEVAVRRAGSFARYMQERDFSNISSGFMALPGDQIMVVFRTAENGHS